MSTEENQQLDLASIDFTPDWAKKDAGVTVGMARSSRESANGKGERPRFEGRDRARKGGRFEGRKPGSDGWRKGGRPPSSRAESPRPPRPKFTFDVKLLPESKALGTVIRKVQQDFHAYKLRELANFFLNNPQSILVKLAVTPLEEGSQEPLPRLYQCKACGSVALSEEEMVAHILSCHLTDYYTEKEVACEPPKGQFTCVVKCGLSGVVLGPPNAHDFGSKVREMIRTRYPHLSEEAYRAKLEMVHDADAIEAWRQSAAKKICYVVKDAPEGAPELTREQAEVEFKRVYLASLCTQPKTVMATAEVLSKSTCKPLIYALNDALRAERQRPVNMIFALRGAFHHRKLHLFHANDARGPEFVIGTELKEFDADHAIPELARLARMIEQYPCLFRNEIVKTEEEDRQLEWLISTGHIVGYTNGAFTKVEKFPKYGPDWNRKSLKALQAAQKAAESAAPAAPVTADAAPVEAEPAATPVAAASETAPATEAPAPEIVEDVKKEEERKDETSTQLAE